MKGLNVLYMSCHLVYVTWTCLIGSWNIRCITDLVSIRLLCVNPFCSRTEWRHKCLHYSFNFPLVGPPFENSIKSLVVGTPLERDINFPMVGKPFECDTNSPWWGTIRDWHQLSVVGKPFDIDINSPWWGNHSRLTSIHVFRTAVMCHINPRAGDSNWVSYQFTWLGHHSGVTSAPHGGDTIRMWRCYITISVTIVKKILVRCILITWTCKRVQIHNGDNVNDSYWGEILQMR